MIKENSEEESKELNFGIFTKQGELLITVDAHSEAEALNIVYDMDNNDQIDYSKAKNTRRKYTGEEDQDFLQEFVNIRFKT